MAFGDELREAKRPRQPQGSLTRGGTSLEVSHGRRPRDDATLQRRGERSKNGACGAPRGASGHGAEIGGDFTLYAGTVLGIVVGGAGGTAPNHGAGGGGGSFVWIVSAPVVPEPSTWARMLAGFAGLGFLGYGQRQKLASAARA